MTTNEISSYTISFLPHFLDLASLYPFQLLHNTLLARSLTNWERGPREFSRLGRCWEFFSGSIISPLEESWWWKLSWELRRKSLSTFSAGKTSLASNPKRLILHHFLLLMLRLHNKALKRRRSMRFWSGRHCTGRQGFYSRSRRKIERVWILRIIVLPINRLDSENNCPSDKPVSTKKQVCF